MKLKLFKVFLLITFLSCTVPLWKSQFYTIVFSNDSKRHGLPDLGSNKSRLGANVGQIHMSNKVLKDFLDPTLGQGGDTVINNRTSNNNYTTSGDAALLPLPPVSQRDLKVKPSPSKRDAMAKTGPTNQNVRKQSDFHQALNESATGVKNREFMSPNLDQRNYNERNDPPPLSNQVNQFSNKPKHLAKKWDDSPKTGVDQEKAHKSIQNRDTVSNHSPNSLFPHNIDFVINQPHFCRKNNSSPDAVFLLAMAISKPDDFEMRQMQRNSCLSITKVSERNIRSIFLLGDPANQSMTKELRKEAEMYRDVIMGDFTDAYRNLTLKTLMGIKWASVHCPQAQYVMKTDDNVFISLRNIVSLLQDSPRENFMIGRRKSSCD